MLMLPFEGIESSSKWNKLVPWSCAEGQTLELQQMKQVRSLIMHWGRIEWFTVHVWVDITLYYREWYTLHGWVDHTSFVIWNGTLFKGELTPRHPSKGIVHCVWVSWPFGIEIGNPLTPSFNLFNGRLGPQTRSFLFPFSGATLLMVTRSIHSLVHICQWVHYKSYIYRFCFIFKSWIRDFIRGFVGPSVGPSVCTLVCWSICDDWVENAQFRNFNWPCVSGVLYGVFLMNVV